MIWMLSLHNKMKFSIKDFFSKKNDEKLAFSIGKAIWSKSDCVISELMWSDLSNTDETNQKLVEVWYFLTYSCSRYQSSLSLLEICENDSYWFC